MQGVRQGLDTLPRGDNMQASSSGRLAVDIGGTFTDLVLARPDGGFVSGKLLTTPAAPEQAVLQGTADILRRRAKASRIASMLSDGPVSAARLAAWLMLLASLVLCPCGFSISRIRSRGAPAKPMRQPVMA